MSAQLGPSEARRPGGLAGGPASEPITGEMMAERLSGLAVDRAAPRTPAQDAYLSAAAVLASFSPEELHPVEVAPDETALADLLHVCQPVQDRGRLRWRLPDLLRRETIRRLGERALDELVAAVVSTDRGPVQRMLSAYATRSAPPLGQQSYEELLATAQVTEWLHGLVDGVPALGAVQGRLETAELLAPLRRLVGTSFQGRRRVLEQLHDYADILPAGSPVKSVRRQLRRFSSLQDNPPLVLHGPGGVGKSTVLAKFILDHVDAASSVPFVYVDLDRPGMLGQEPLTLLVDAVRQLGIQHRPVRRQADALRHRWLERLARSEFRMLSATVIDPPTETLTGSAGVSESARLRSTVSARRPFYREFAELVGELGSDGPLLFALDTFETVQRFGADTVHEVLEFLDGLQHELPSLRVLIAGRAPIEGYPTRSVPLSGFDDAAARGFLASLHDGRLAGDPALLEHVLRSAGRSPLSLRLAADLVVNHGAAALADVDSRRTMFARVRTEQVQGWLYRRILDRVVDPDVRALAHPGLVVRRLTPAVIRWVLAGPCGLDVPDDDRARELFDRCSREVSLLSWTTDGALEHRADVRREMLPLLRRAEPARVAAIHDAAVEHHRRHAGGAARAEEIYHRLCRGDLAAELDERWQHGIEAFLIRSLDELPAGSQVYLASRIGVTLPPDVLADAALGERERYVAARARQLITYGELETALAALRAEPERAPGSPLDLLEARAYEQLGRLAEAAEVLDRASQRAADATDADALVELHYYAARIAERLGDTNRALALLGLTGALDADRRDPLLPLRIASAETRLRRTTPAGAPAAAGAAPAAGPARPAAPSEAVAAGDPEAGGAARRRLAEVLAATPAELVAGDPSLLAELAGEIGAARRDLVVLALLHVGLPEPDEEESARLGTALAEWDDRNGRRPSALLRLGADEQDRVAAWTRWLRETPRATATSDLVGVLERHVGDEPVIGAIAGLYRRALDERRAPGSLPPPG